MSLPEPTNQPDQVPSNPLEAQEQFRKRLQGHGTEVLRSSQGERIVRFKRGLVLELFLRRGRFWEEITAIRDRWGLQADARLVSELRRVHDAGIEGEMGRTRWDTDLYSLRDHILPDRCPSEPTVWWTQFLEACVLNDPHETELIEFANIGGPFPSAPVSLARFWPPTEEREATPPSGNSEMIAPPIKRLADASKAVVAERWLHKQILDRINERHLKPRGIDIHELYRQVLADSEDIRAEHQELERQNPRKQYIEVSETTTEYDVRHAFRLIRQTQPEAPKGGRPPLDELLAVQLAIIYDRHNPREDTDKRVRTWTHKSLAKRFGLPGARAVQRHVQRGRELLE